MTQQTSASGSETSADPYAIWFSNFAGRSVLIAEDTQVHADRARAILERAGCARVIVVADGAAALDLANREAFDVLVLDREMPNLEGVELLRRIRQGNGPCKSAIAVFVTTHGSPVERRQGNAPDVRADAYIVKPVEDDELVARIGSEIEKRQWRTKPSVYVNGPLAIDANAPRVRIRDREIEITSRHYDILLLLIEHLGKPVTRPMLARAGWRESWGANSYFLDTFRENCISQTLTRIRAELKAQAPADLADAFGKLIISVRNEGVRMVAFGSEGDV